MQNKIIKGMLWKLLERFGVQGVQFILQIVLARLLAPEHYGTLSLLVIFTNLANIFVQSGFNTALIQNKDVTDEDYSSVFWVSLTISIGLYAILFMAAPFIANFYALPDIVAPFRILALMLIPGALNSVQVARISRNMDFKQVFKSNLIAIIVSGVVGIVLAYMHAGLWALVAQALTNSVIVCVVMLFTVKWHPRFVCNFSRIKELFSFGWKLLVSSLLDTLYQDLSSLVIGKKYSSGTLGYYNRGKQFPQFVINAINGSVRSVLLTAMSECQDNRRKVKQLMRTSISCSAYIVFPMMAGLAAVAEPLVELLLTSKWGECVPYMQIYCVSLAFYPVHSCNLQAINAMGRSDIFLKLEVIKKICGIIILGIAVFGFNSPLAIALSSIISTIIGWIINSYPNKRLVEYSYKEQFGDILPSLIMSFLMCVCVIILGNLQLGSLLKMFMQIIIGIIIYIVLSIIIKPYPYVLIMEQIHKMKK